MKQIISAVAFVTAVAVAGPAMAEAPFGNFGGKVGGGNAGAGVMRLQGWALDDDGVAAVDIVVDGRVVGRAQYGRSRPNVARNFPSYPDSDAAGFAFQLDTTRFLNGLHQVWPRVLSVTGETRDLEKLTFEFLNLTHNLVPFGAIEFPSPDAELFGNCPTDSGRKRYSVISGYALDVGVEIGDQGVGYVELLIDGSIVANSRRDCFFRDATGGLTDCYGLRRLDLANIFPNLPNAPLAGFRFVLDIGGLIDFGYTRGRHVLTIRAGDISGQVANIAEIPVFFSCDDDTDNEGAFGLVGRPRNGLIYTGTIDVVGWALDWEGINRIEILVDGAKNGNALIGQPRPGIAGRYPGYPESPAPGFSYALDTTELSDGPHHIEVVVYDEAGGSTLIGERRITVFNP